MLRRTFDVPPMQEDKRKGVTRTEVAVAFPVNQDGHPLLLLDVPVFGFLPICCMGLKIAVQADFVLSASREGVLADRPWNKWLRDECLAQLLAGPALELLKRRQADGAFLRYLPLPGELAGDSFMAPLEPALLQALASQPCVMAHDGSWCRPSEVLLLSAPFLGPGGGEPLLPGGMLERLTGLKYVRDGLAADSRAADILRRLGVGHFGAVHMVQCLSHASAGAELAAELASRTAPGAAAAWMAQLYRSLDEARLSDGQWKQLADAAPILLLHDGRPGDEVHALGPEPGQRRPVH